MLNTANVCYKSLVFKGFHELGRSAPSVLW
jgi:hypothetical protein